jgi:homoserine kinase type II
LQPAIRDIHRDHVLFTGDEVTGLVDFGALRIDTPLADLARLIGSLASDNAAARQLALDAYAAVIPLSNTDRQLVDLLDDSGILLGGLNWLQWLYVERRDIGELLPIIARLDEIVGRLTRRRGDAERGRD